MEAIDHDGSQKGEEANETGEAEHHMTHRSSLPSKLALKSFAENKTSIQPM
jgi:hypothetical protein